MSGLTSNLQPPGILKQGASDHEIIEEMQPMTLHHNTNAGQFPLSRQSSRRLMTLTSHTFSISPQALLFA